MPDLKSFLTSGCVTLAIITILLTGSLSSSFASPNRRETLATYHCDIDTKGNVRINFMMIARTSLSAEQKAALEKALGMPLSDKLAREYYDELEDMEEAIDEESEEAEDSEERVSPQPTNPKKRKEFLFAEGTRNLPKQGFEIAADFHLNELIQVLQELQVEQLQVTVTHKDSPYSNCTKSNFGEELNLPERHFDFYTLALSEGVTEPSTIHISYGYPASAIVKKLSILGALLLFPILLLVMKRKRLKGLAENDATSARYSAFRSLNTLSIGFPLIWLLAYSQTGLSEVLEFIEIDGGVTGRLLIPVVAYMVIPTTVFLICKAILYPFLTNADDKRFRMRDFFSESAALIFGGFFPLVFLVWGAVSIFRGYMAYGLGFLAAAFICLTIGKAIKGKTAQLTPYALVAKSLRDRVFEIAARAGVNLTEVFVLPLDKDKTANAFATTKNTVLLNEYLLRRLSRREVDAVVAHEIAHLRLNHPRMLTLCFGIGLVAPIILPFFLKFAATFLSTVSVKFYYLFAYVEDSNLLFPVSIALSTLAFLVLSRRFEYSADAFSVTVTGDAEAMITALIRLAKLSLLPMDWGKWDENLLTHPSTMNRIKALAMKYGVSQERLAQLIQCSAEPEDTYSLEETVAPLVRPAGAVVTPAYQTNTIPQANPKKQTLKYTLVPVQLAFFVMIFLFFLIRQVPGIKKMAYSSGLPIWGIILLGGISALLISSYLRKRKIVNVFPSTYQFYKTSVKNFPGLDLDGLHRYSEELTRLGFEAVIDYTFESNCNQNLKPFSRLFLHPQYRCFAEVTQILAGNIGVTKIHCAISSSLEGDWFYTSQDKEAMAWSYGNRLPNYLFDTKQGGSVFELLDFHLSNREAMAALLNSKVNTDLSFEAYLSIGAKLEFKKKEKIRNTNALRYLLELDKCERNPKSSWYGKLEKQLS